MTYRALPSFLLLGLTIAACGGDPAPNDNATSSSSSGQGGDASSGGGGMTTTTSSAGGDMATTSSAGGSGGEGGTPCVAETDAELCTAASAECGTIDVTDACGMSRSPDCGGCSGLDTCGGADVANTCGCTNETDSEFCSANSWTCGMQTGNDNCGDARTAECGGCSGYTSCDVSGSCSCEAPPAPTLTSCIDSGGPKLVMSSPTGWVAMSYATGTGTPAACGFQSNHHQIMGNGINLSAPFLNECGTYRFCSWNVDDICDEDYSEDKLMQICVNGVGQPTCTFL